MRDDDPIERRRKQRQSRERTRLALVIGAVGLLLAVAVVAVVVTSMKKQKDEPEVAQPWIPPPQTPPPVPSDKPAYYLSYGRTDPYPEGAGLPFIQGGNFDYQFRENQLKARRTYIGKRFFVSGPVASLSVEGMQAVTIVIGQPNFSSAFCRCSANDPLLLKIRTAAGDRATEVTVEGVCTNFDSFEECRVLVVR